MLILVFFLAPAFGWDGNPLKESICFCRQHGQYLIGEFYHCVRIVGIERIAAGGYDFEDSYYSGILGSRRCFYWKYEHRPNAQFFAQLRVNPPIGIRVAAKQDFATIKAEPGEADPRMQTRPNFRSRGPGGGLAIKVTFGFCAIAVFAETDSCSASRRNLHCLGQKRLKCWFRA